jgi:hypothetical protein
MQALSHDAKITRHSNAIAAGATNVTTLTGVDMAGYDAVCFVICLGTITSGAATSAKAQSSSGAADGTGDAFADIAGSSVTIADTLSNKIVYVDVIRPVERWVRLAILRATQNAAIDSITAIQYQTKDHRPVTHDTTVSIGKTLVDSINGTA